jgi:hypothetical protein
LLEVAREIGTTPTEAAALAAAPVFRVIETVASGLMRRIGVCMT